MNLDTFALNPIQPFQRSNHTTRILYLPLGIVFRDTIRSNHESHIYGHKLGKVGDFFRQPLHICPPSSLPITPKVQSVWRKCKQRVPELTVLTSHLLPYTRGFHFTGKSTPSVTVMSCGALYSWVDAGDL